MLTLNSKRMLISGNEMPVMGLGTWELTDDPVGAIAYAIALGYPMIDTSSDYGTQPAVGDALLKSGVPRSQIYLVTKIEETDDAYQRVLSNLEDLKTDYADLVLIHRPPKNGAGVDLWEGLIRARDEGLVKDIGVSNYTAAQIDELIGATGEIPAVNQIEWSPFGHSDRMLNYSLDDGIVIQAYSPLTRATRIDDVTLIQIAQKYDKSPAQILVRWNLQLGTVPITKANKRQHLEQDIEVFDFELTDEDMKILHKLNEKYSALGELPYLKGLSPASQTAM
jgi:diketogulonate reductase-like aldo/keto reductase